MFEQHNEYFEVTDAHLTLLRDLYVPRSRKSDGIHDFICLVDMKRPFGNSDIIGDAIKLVCADSVPNEDGEYSNDDVHYVWILLGGLRTVFQIMIDNLSIQVGMYKRTTDQYQIHKTPWRVLED